MKLLTQLQQKLYERILKASELIQQKSVFGENISQGKTKETIKIRIYQHPNINETKYP